VNRLTLVSRAPRAALACIAMAAAVGLAACGQPAFDNSFNTSFDKSAHDSCLTSAEGHGVPAATAGTYCGCFVAQLDKLTVQRKMALNANSPEMQQAISACSAQMTAPTNNAAPQ
jgi:hypothetical protein